MQHVVLYVVGYQRVEFGNRFGAHKHRFAFYAEICLGLVLYHIFVAILQKVFYKCDVECDELNGSLPQIKVKQRVAQREVEQFPLPDVEFGCLGIRIHNAAEVVARMFLHVEYAVVVAHAVGLHRPYAVLVYPLRKRKESFEAASLDVDKNLEFAGVHQVSLCRFYRVLERCVF